VLALVLAEHLAKGMKAEFQQGLTSSPQLGASMAHDT
jgi:hypothetical protein